MCVYIGIEDLVANAFIELVDKSERKEIMLSQINEYGAKVVKFLLAEGKKAILILSEEETHDFLHDYSDYFELFSNDEGEGLRLKQGITVDQLWEKFRGYLSYDVMMAFMDEQSVKALGV